MDPNSRRLVTTGAASRAPRTGLRRDVSAMRPVLPRRRDWLLIFVVFGISVLVLSFALVLWAGNSR
jgi:hypothetical protein